MNNEWTPEIPEGWQVATDEELAHSMSVVEYNRWMNMPSERARRYAEAILRRNLKFLEASK